MYALRDSSGQFVARSRGSVAAHRASRRARHLGSSVNRAGEVQKSVTGSGPYSIYFETGGYPEGTKAIVIRRYKTRKEARYSALQIQRAHGGYVTINKGGSEVDDVGPSGASWLAAANRLLPHSARVFKPSESFSAIVRTGRSRLGMAADTVIVTYQGPSLSTARVKAKIAADQWGRPVDVVDDQWRKIATYGPGSGA